MIGNGALSLKIYLPGVVIVPAKKVPQRLGILLGPAVDDAVTLFRLFELEVEFRKTAAVEDAPADELIMVVLFLDWKRMPKRLRTESS